MLFTLVFTLSIYITNFPPRFKVPPKEGKGKASTLATSTKVTFSALEARTCSQVCSRYNSDYPQRAAKPVWTGNTSSCDLGNYSSDDVTDSIRRINLYRWLVGIVNGTVSTTSIKNLQANYCALIMDANSNLSHDPPSTWKCWTQSGHDGAGWSDIAWGQTDGPYAVRTYMMDPGVISVGHRRWLLYPPMNTVGFGQRNQGNCIQVINSDYLWRDNIPFVAYPAPGPFPIAEVFDYWSFGCNSNLQGANVTIVRSDGVNVPCTVDSTTALSGWYGQPTINIYGISRSLIIAGYSYTVTVTLNSTQWVYTTRLYNCSQTCPSTGTSTATVSPVPTSSPTQSPTASPVPTSSPTKSPTASPVPTSSPTKSPTASPVPTSSPTQSPTASPIPTSSPTKSPTASPIPTSSPTKSPTASPIPTSSPTKSPTASPIPTSSPTKSPTASPVPTSSPSKSPTAFPAPTSSPTKSPTASPVPTSSPSKSPTASPAPTSTPTQSPTASPAPTSLPTAFPTASATQTPPSCSQACSQQLSAIKSEILAAFEDSIKNNL